MVECVSGSGIHYTLCVEWYPKLLPPLHGGYGVASSRRSFGRYVPRRPCGPGGLIDANRWRLTSNLSFSKIISSFLGLDPSFYHFSLVIISILFTSFSLKLGMLFSFNSLFCRFRKLDNSLLSLFQIFVKRILYDIPFLFLLNQFLSKRFRFHFT